MRRPLIAIAAFIAIIVTGAAVFTWRVARQDRLDRELADAAERQQTARVVALLNEGANPNARLPVGPPPTVWEQLRAILRGQRAPAAAHRPAALVLALCGNGGYPPENVRLVKALLDHCANPNAIVTSGGADIGWTPLMMAATCVKDETIRLLLTRGARPDTKSPDGETALDYAEMTGDGPAITMLREQIARHLVSGKQQAAAGSARPLFNELTHVTRYRVEANGIIWFNVTDEYDRMDQTLARSSIQVYSSP